MNYTHLKTWLLWKKSGFVPLILLVIHLLSSCQNKTDTEEEKIILRPVTGIQTSFNDETKDLPGGKISWSTFWQVCWAKYPEAVAYEIQTITSEGVSPKLKKQPDSCYRIQIASGVNSKSQGLLNREMLIGLQSGQLAYKIRAVLEENRFSEWSDPIMIK